MYCARCGLRLPEDARFCAKCGRVLRAEAQLSLRPDDRRRERRKVVGVALGSLLALVFLGFLFFGVPLLYQQHHDRVPQQSAQATPPPAKPRTGKETLAAARELLSSGDAVKASDLLRPLAADPKYGPEARRLLKRATSQMVDELAAGMQKSMFDAGEEVYVKAIGAEKDAIQFSGPLISAVWVHQFASGDLPRKLQSMGFKRVLFANSITGESWSQKLD